MTKVTQEPTERELQALDMLTRGYNNFDIARDMGIAYGSAKNILWRVYKKIGVKNSRAAAYWYAKIWKGQTE